MTSDYMSFFMFALKAVFELSLERENKTVSDAEIQRHFKHLFFV